MSTLKNYLVIKLTEVDNFIADCFKFYIETSVDMITGSFDAIRDLSFTQNDILESYSPQKGDTFYFLPGVSIPRVKLKDLGSQYGIKIVRDPDKASHIFAGRKTGFNLFDDNWYHTCDTQSFIEFIESCKEGNHIDSYYYDKLKTALEFYTEDVVILGDNFTAKVFTEVNLPFSLDKVYYGDKGVTRNRQTFHKVADAHKDLYDAIVSKQLTQEVALMPYINGPEAVVIDADMHKAISDMFMSSDKENWTVAMEIMANCDYVGSILYLVDLFYDFGSRISDMPSRNHVNFKALKSYMGFDRHLSPGMDDCVEILRDKNALTRDNLMHLLNKFQDNIPGSYSKHFQVKAVTMSEEFDKLMNEELIVNLKDNYTQEEEHVNTNTINFDFI